MAKKKFTTKVSPLTGSSLLNLIKLVRENEVGIKYYPKLSLYIIAAAAIEPFRWIERNFYKKKVEEFEIKEDPVFIVGHWRSGTTFLHNLICEDPEIGFVTTHQGIYPENIFSGNKVIKGMMKIFMPKHRAADNMELGIEFPQEEEFALTNIHGLSYYNFWFFPNKWKTFYKRFVEFNGVPKSAIDKWKTAYEALVKKALINTNRKRFVSKNPPNTGRIDKLLELFPNARFIHIYRNPITTFVSTKKFIEGTIGPIKLNDITEEELDENILWTYTQLMSRFELQRSLIPKENLIEIKFEDFEKDPVKGMETIYSALNLPGFENLKPRFVKYLSSKKDFKKNEHKIPEEIVNRVSKRWSFAMAKGGYNKPPYELSNKIYEAM